MDKIETEVKLEQEVKTEKKIDIPSWEDKVDFSREIDQTEETLEDTKETEKLEETSDVTPYVASFENITIKEIKEKQKETEITPYVASFENITIEELRRREEEKKAEEVTTLEEKGQVVAQDTTEESKVKLVIHKPNYDFMPKEKKQKKKHKFRSLILAAAVLLCGIGGVTGGVIIDNMSQSYIELQDQYELNLWKYIRNIESLNATDKGMDFIETYPEELNDISSISESTNWFNEITDYTSNLFGG